MQTGQRGFGQIHNQVKLTEISKLTHGADYKTLEFIFINSYNNQWQFSVTLSLMFVPEPICQTLKHFSALHQVTQYLNFSEFPILQPTP
jgi:hypothetical protein